MSVSPSRCPGQGLARSQCSEKEDGKVWGKAGWCMTTWVLGMLLRGEGIKSLLSPAFP